MEPMHDLAKHIARDRYTEVPDTSILSVRKHFSLIGILFYTYSLNHYFYTLLEPLNQSQSATDCLSKLILVTCLQNPSVAHTLHRSSSLFFAARVFSGWSSTLGQNATSTSPPLKRAVLKTVPCFRLLENAKNAKAYWIII